MVEFHRLYKHLPFSAVVRKTSSRVIRRIRTRTFATSHVCRYVSILNPVTQVGRVGLHQQPIRRNPSHGLLLQLIKARGQTKDAIVAPRDCGGPTKNLVENGEQEHSTRKSKCPAPEYAGQLVAKDKPALTAPQTLAHIASGPNQSLPTRPPHPFSPHSQQALPPPKRPQKMSPKDAFGCTQQPTRNQ
ncbi:hypothetical protein DPMN_083498 [Dreissena polymorpha]|uniref:Uncharacterized protein n=1 Tax=Dreissena polymorpha TaxID=45954 RepID=A0A9D4BB57_DREPO|nr:hypothetical protein DPMN_083498 [Dreissena polymorpha]